MSKIWSFSFTRDHGQHQWIDFREHRNRKPYIFPFFLWGFPVNFPLNQSMANSSPIPRDPGWDPNGPGGFGYHRVPSYTSGGFNLPLWLIYCMLIMVNIMVIIYMVNDG